MSKLLSYINKCMIKSFREQQECIYFIYLLYLVLEQ